MHLSQARGNHRIDTCGCGPTLVTFCFSHGLVAGRTLVQEVGVLPSWPSVLEVHMETVDASDKLEQSG
jgi:hypothetical protein